MRPDWSIPCGGGRRRVAHRGGVGGAHDELQEWSGGAARSQEQGHGSDDAGSWRRWCGAGSQDLGAGATSLAMEVD